MTFYWYLQLNARLAGTNISQMNSKKAKKLFNKYVSGECSERERELLESFLDSFQDTHRLRSELQFDEELKTKIWTKIKAGTAERKVEKVRRLSFAGLLKYAAVIAGISIGIYFWAYSEKEAAPSLVINEEMVVLKTATEANNIDEGANGQISNASGKVIASQKGNLLTYLKDSMVRELVYNEIKVPRGKTFKLLLSDGTSIHLNASTTLRFPINFKEGEDRKVFLDGEAFFDVAKDENHPFLVNANGMDVSVLGTVFNINSYADTKSHAVLVEGSVSVRERGANDVLGVEQIIVPGQKATVVGGNIKVEEVDVNDYTGWTQDLLIFNDESFADIVRKIERKYNVDIKNNYPELTPVRFNGKFREETITDLMDTFKESAGFDYHIQDNKIIINKKNSANALKTNQ